MSLEHRTLGLIEDDPIMGESLARSLTLEGAKVHWWACGNEALSQIPAASVDAVICDIRLPDRSGAEIFRELARVRGAPPFLFITGYGDIDQAVELMREGARDYLTKPFVMSEFLARLEQVVGRQETQTDPVLGVSPVRTLLMRSADCPGLFAIPRNVPIPAGTAALPASSTT